MGLRRGGDSERGAKRQEKDGAAWDPLHSPQLQATRMAWYLSPEAWAGRRHALWEPGPGPLADSFGAHSAISPDCDMFSEPLHKP